MYMRRKEANPLLISTDISTAYQNALLDPFSYLYPNAAQCIARYVLLPPPFWLTEAAQ